MFKFTNINRLELISFFLLFVLFSSCGLKQEQSIDTVDEFTDNCEYKYGICIDSLDVTYYTIQRGDLLAPILSKLNFTGNEIESICQVIEPLHSSSKLQIGSTYATITSQDSIQAIKYLVFEKNRTDYVVIDLCNDNITAYESSKPVTLRREFVEGTIRSSLWNTLADAGAPVILALKLSDIFAWQIDFFDVKEGDSFRLMYDVAYIDDSTFVDIASIEGAVFTHQGKNFKAIPFEQDSIREYFDEEGNSLRKEFLKSPLDFYRITSRFSNSRLHPVLKRYRAHHGVDYAAPTGTPVKTIGDGVVVEKSYQGNGAGNYLKIKHNAVYTTTYMHLSRYAKGIEKGSRVRQGDIIGYVGSTGLSTGPHLDFRVHKNNQPINPLSMEAPPSLPVKPELRDSFMLVYKRVQNELDSLQFIEKLYASEVDTVSLSQGG